MLILKIFTLAVLVALFVQDIRSRSVYWYLFPVLTILLVMERIMQHQSAMEIWRTVSVNTILLVLFGLILSAYFSIKNWRWVNITDGMLGWGDILFLTSLVFYLSVLNFLFFYIISLIGVLLILWTWQYLIKKKTEQIPLAGWQALMLTLFLATDWWYLHINLTSDDWLLNLLNK